VQNVLISSYPWVICRVFNFALDAISVHFKKLCWSFVIPFNELENTGTAKCRDDEGLPYQGIVASQICAGGAPRAAAREESDEEPI
jgi:hypothetical protein